MGAVGKSGRVLYAFNEFYLSFYGIEPTFLFQNFEVFGCISAAVYCVDESVEQRSSVRQAVQVNALERLVAERMSIDNHVAALLKDAKEYWAFESNMGTELLTCDLAKALRITQIRSFDFRLMHHALLQITGITYDEQVFEWFRAFEMLMEIEDDLPTLKEDEQRGGYNFYGLARRIVGVDARQVVEQTRKDLEEQLDRDGVVLRQRGYSNCSEVISKYRRIVPKPPIPVDTWGGA
jgi:hypothetical protein